MAIPEEHGWLAALISSAFDPAWNVGHRTIIWPAITTSLFLSGTGLPLPEDIPLTLAGFTTFKQAHDHVLVGHFLATFVMVVVPILLGDLLAYNLGSRYGFGLRERIPFLRRALSVERMTKVQEWFDRYGAFTIFIGRQMAGIRFVTFFTAGTVRLPLYRFVLFDFLGCLVSVPVWLTLGVVASRYGEAWLHLAVRRVGGGFFLVALVVSLVFFAAVKLRAGRARTVPDPPPSG